MEKAKLFKLKVAKSKEIIKEAFDRFKKLAVVWSTGKDSSVLLYMARQFDPDIPVLFNKTGVDFEETIEFGSYLAKKWKLNLVEIVPETSYEKVKGDYEKCCYELKTRPALKKIEELGLDAVMVGIRWDEHPARADEDYFSKRKSPDHWRVHPLLHWREEDVWNFIRQNNLPYNPLYDKGYRSIGCKFCTKPVPPEAPERAGRDLDRKEIMRRLRELGYW